MLVVGIFLAVAVLASMFVSPWAGVFVLVVTALASILYVYPLLGVFTLGLTLLLTAGRSQTREYSLKDYDGGEYWS